MKKWKIGWGVAQECNMHCKFCYSSEARANRDAIGLEDCKKFIDDNSEWISSINYGTGESTLNTNWFSLVDYVRKKAPFIEQSLTTNGYLSKKIVDSSLEEIFVNSIDEVDVSLDFADKEKHCIFRGQKDAFNWAIDTLEYLNKVKKVTTIVFVGTEATLQKDNIDGLFKIAKYYDAKVRLNIYRPTSRDEVINNQYIVSYKTLICALEYINSKYKVLSISDPLFASILLEHETVTDPSGLYSLRILPDGSITPSTYLTTEEYMYSNIKNPFVLKYLTESRVFDGFRGNCLPNECMNCRYKIRCAGGALDRRYLWFGSNNKADPYCPFNYNNYFPNFKIQLTEDTSFSSVHDGYLPTMFFGN
ncbi:MAG: radical SAM protein [Ruminococcus flavefaciens]|nr:radical SAM protein [Ruminococcus flavefaciens]